MRTFAELEKSRAGAESWGLELPLVWCLLGGRRYTTEDVAKLRELLDGYRCFVWRIFEGGAGSPAVRNLKRAFGDWPALKRTTLVRDSLLLASGEAYFCDVAEVLDENQGDLVKLARSSYWGARCGIFFKSETPACFPRYPLRLFEATMKGLSRQKREALLRSGLKEEREEGNVHLLDVYGSSLELLVVFTPPLAGFEYPTDRMNEAEFLSVIDAGIDLAIFQ